MSQVLVIGNYSSACGGGLLNDNYATAQLDSVSFASNQAPNGAAIYNRGQLTLTHSSLTFDIAGNQGGGLTNSENAFLADVNISYETANSNGGGIYNNGYLTLTQTTLNKNQATNERVVRLITSTKCGLRIRPSAPTPPATHKAAAFIR